MLKLGRKNLDAVESDADAAAAGEVGAEAVDAGAVAAMDVTKKASRKRRDRVICFADGPSRCCLFPVEFVAGEKPCCIWPCLRT